MEFCRNINGQYDQFLEELLGLRSDMDSYYYTTDAAINGVDVDINGISCFDPSHFPISDDHSTYPQFLLRDYSSLPLFTTADHHQAAFHYTPFGDDKISPPDLAQHSSPSQTRPPPHTCQFSTPVVIIEDENGLPDPNPSQPAETPPELVPAFHMGSTKEASRKKLPVNGRPPSKNLMAERRRRKRLNDRLAMLRSVVPKISKMDRTSILGDTIDYIKELLDRITTLQHQQHQHMHNLGSSNHQLMSLMSIFQESKPNQLLLRNSPKFEVERRNLETRVEICCGGKPGLLLSTVTTLEALGLDIHHSVISCFDDFTLQASCSEELKKRSILDSEDIKEALLRNAGYGTAN